jgi:hypothetical protein
MSGYPARNVYDGLKNRFRNIFPTQFVPEDYNWISWAFDPLLAYTSAAPVAGTQYFSAIPIRRHSLITNIIMDVQTAGAGLTAGQCVAGLFDKTGKLLSATADQATNWQSTGLKTMALSSPQPVMPGIYYAAHLWNGTTGPKFAYCAAQLATNGANSGSFMRAGLDVAHPTITSFVSPATITSSNTPYWAAVS